VDEPSPTLTTDTALRTAARIAAEFSWSCLDAHVLGPVGENASVLLPREQLVLRICAVESYERARRELRLAGWLRDSGVPAARMFGGVDTPLLYKNWAVTVWQYVPGVRPAPIGLIGTVLRRLHELTDPPDMELPSLDPFDGIDGYIDQAQLNSEETSFLRHRLDRLRSDYARLEPGLPPGPVHGDAHRKNIVQDSNGNPVLLDLERFSTGLREWDLVVAAVYERLGWYTPAEYAAFTAAYGWDIRAWSGFETTAAVRELRMTAWLCARTGREPHLLPEARRRIASLGQTSGAKRWRPGT
jgi:aminoglycoside phosphotransferase (APT) family kinase protein